MRAVRIFGVVWWRSGTRGYVIGARQSMFVGWDTKLWHVFDVVEEEDERRGRIQRLTSGCGWVDKGQCSSAGGGGKERGDAVLAKRSRASPYLYVRVALLRFRPRNATEACEPAGDMAGLENGTETGG